jgi:hypothetical protein
MKRARDPEAVASFADEPVRVPKGRERGVEDRVAGNPRHGSASAVQGERRPPARPVADPAEGRYAAAVGGRTRLDEFVPVWQFNEVHRTRVAASPDRIFSAIKTVTADEILFFRTLVWLRRLGRAGTDGILNPAERTPILDVALRTTFLGLAEDSPRELLVGTLVIAPSGP